MPAHRARTSFAITTDARHALLIADALRARVEWCRVSDSQRLDELANLIVIAGGNENHPTTLYAKR
jgi:hypothetical protein